MDKRNPLFLPKGSVRSLLALAFSFAFIGAALGTGEVPTDLGVITAGIVAWYFGTRSQAA